MKNGSRGTFVISLDQTAVDGQAAPPLRLLRVGALWRWSGDAVRVDGGAGAWPERVPDEMTDIRRRAARSVRKLFRNADPGRVRRQAAVVEERFADGGFILTDGQARWTATLICPEAGSDPLCLFADGPPPRDTDLWIVDAAPGPTGPDRDAPSGAVICFTPCTTIRTRTGLRPVEDIRAGELVQTMDNGCQRVLWTGRRRITGARLHALPDLAPVRFLPGALGDGVPDAGLLVSPDHRILLASPRAEALYNAPEVLVTARDLVDGARVTRDRERRGVTYVHLALERHEIVFANGVATESFHPAALGLESLGAADRQRLLDLVPDLARDPMAFGAFARRMLSAPEASILAGH
ncbi:Hint domain-containing protein [Roseisalinus antarcticus]|uniref:Hedgehog/Intein (Hint) domain-containing protein n=1 Tax=Roseisalinus antarcticus TaxID=254357 RepID=A0A1Y5TQT8_9RHOB|nr:Hint domain-containing protein [Roseisalinus antarcticus]SLN69941.1 hypothetical protein ROA7023_03402 [Roseisalinus antarcticus]